MRLTIDMKRMAFGNPNKCEL